MTDRSTEPSDASWNPRSRPIVSCLNCRRKKQKCDRRSPCNSCIRSGKPESCEYAPGQEPILDKGDEESQSTTKRRRIDSDDRSDIDSQVTTASFKKLRERVSQLEGALLLQQQQIQDLINFSGPAQEQPSGVQHYSPWQNEQKRTSELALYKPLRIQVCETKHFEDGFLIGAVSRFTVVYPKIG